MALGAGEPAERADLLEADEAQCLCGGRSIVRQRDLLSVWVYAHTVFCTTAQRDRHGVLCERSFATFASPAIAFSHASRFGKVTYRYLGEKL